MTRVNLYAFANTRPSYSVCFAPERPLIVLKTQKSSSNNNNNNKEDEQNKCKLVNNDHDNEHDDQCASKENALAQKAMNACLQ